MTQPQVLVQLPDVQRITGFSKPWIYREMSLGRFPRPIRIGAKAVRWVRADIDSWIADRVREDRERSDIAVG